MGKERRRRPGRLSKRNALKVEARKVLRRTVRSRPSGRRNGMVSGCEGGGEET
jgi:hypothetical protein